MANYKLGHINFEENRVELHNMLNLTGAEISYNSLPAGAGVPFVHAHKENEEIYIVLDGKGLLFVDGVETEIKKGDCFRIDPKGQRCLKAAADSALQYLCIQTKANSLEHFTMTDGVMSEDMAKPSWL